MRIDKFLKVSRIIKRRTVAKKACKDGHVYINEKNAKPGDDVSIGDIIRVEFGEDFIKIKVKDIRTHIKKHEVDQLIEYI